MSLSSYILNNNNWGKSQFILADLNSPITRIHFVAHMNTNNEPDHPGGEPTNHWTLLFTVSDSRSVHIEAAPNEPGRPGMVIIESNKCGLTGEAVHVVSTNVLSGQTVESLLHVIVNRRRDDYTFDPTGEGCRYWLSTISKDFVEEGIIRKEESDTVIDALKMYWPSPSGTPPVLRPMAHGYFGTDNGAR